jgi:putative addiction module component (TIGR02574 family)
VAVPNIDSLLELDVESRLVLVQKLWDSILEDARDRTAMPVSAEERALLDARLQQEDDDDPDGAIPWSQARTELFREQ